MAVVTFAAIDVGSYELEITIYEISSKNGIRQIDRQRKVVGLGRDTYASGIISSEKVDEVCRLLLRFKETMLEYQVEDYKAYATSALREAKNREVVLDQIKVRTGINVTVLSNSELRFICYKAIAAKETEFNNMILKGTAIAEVGSGSMQISLFDKDALVTTNNIPLGALRVRQMTDRIGGTEAEKNKLIRDLIYNDIHAFKKMSLKGREVKNIIATGVCALYMARTVQDDKQRMSREQFDAVYADVSSLTEEALAKKYDIPPEVLPIIVPGVIMYKELMDATGAEMIWLPGVRLADGTVAEYAEQKKLLHFTHDFSRDITEAARNTAGRYMCNREQYEAMERNVLKIFDATKKYHGLGKRERLLLQISAILNECGRYINLREPGECAYNIIMYTEIIGISHKEREIIANVVKYKIGPFDYAADSPTLTKDMRIKIAKLTAILKVAYDLGRGANGSFNEIKVSLKENTLFISTQSSNSIMLEEARFKRTADFFEEVYGIRPVIRKRKGV